MKLLNLRSNMIFMAKTYKKPIILVEVAYCSSPTEYKSNQLRLRNHLKDRKSSWKSQQHSFEYTGYLGAGIFWWEPATFGGRSTRDFFDENGNVLR